MLFVWLLYLQLRCRLPFAGKKAFASNISSKVERWRFRSSLVKFHRGKLKVDAP